MKFSAGNETVRRSAISQIKAVLATKIYAVNGARIFMDETLQ